MTTIDLTTEETIAVRRAMALGCGLAPKGEVYLLDEEEFCGIQDWQPDFDVSHAVMVAERLFIIADLLMQRRQDGIMEYQFSGVNHPDKPYVRTEFHDSAAFAFYQGSLQAMGIKPGTFDNPAGSTQEGENGREQA